MAITPTVRLSQVIGAPTTSNPTNSITDPGAADLILLRVTSGLTAAATAPSSITGMGRTWTLVAQGSTPNGNVNQALYRSQGSGSTGPLTINYATAPTNMLVRAVSYSGVVQTGINGADAVRQVTPVVANASATIQADFPSAFGGGANVAVSFLSYNAGTTNAMTPNDTDAVKIGTDQSSTSPSVQASSAIDTSPEDLVDWTTGNASGKVLFAVELAAATGSPVVCDAGVNQVDISAFATVTLTFSSTGGTGPYTYICAPPAGITDQSGTGNTRTFTAPADTVVRTYTFTVTSTDSLGASDQDTVDVTVLPWNLWTMRGGVLVARNRKTMRGGSLV